MTNFCRLFCFLSRDKCKRWVKKQIFVTGCPLWRYTAYVYNDDYCTLWLTISKADAMPSKIKTRDVAIAYVDIEPGLGEGAKVKSPWLYQVFIRYANWERCQRAHRPLKTHVGSIHWLVCVTKNIFKYLGISTLCVS